MLVHLEAFSEYPVVMVRPSVGCTAHFAVTMSRDEYVQFANACAEFWHWQHTLLPLYRERMEGAPTS